MESKHEAYQRYLKSSHWQNLRKSAIAKWGNRCGGCETTGKIEVHHLRYGNLYDVTPDDLIPLCEDCHNRIHRSNWLKELLEGATGCPEKRIATRAFLVGMTEAKKQAADARPWTPTKSLNKKQPVSGPPSRRMERIAFLVKHSARSYERLIDMKEKELVYLCRRMPNNPFG